MQLMKLLVVALATGATSFAIAEDGTALAAKLGALQAVRGPSMSPDGSKVAFVAEGVEGSRVYVADLVAGGQPRKVFNIERKVGTIRGCSWTTATRIVCRGSFVSRIETQILPISRMYALNSDGTGFKELTAPMPQSYRGFDLSGGSIIDLDVPGEPGSVLMTRRFLNTAEIGSHLGIDREGLGVELVDTVTLKRKTVEKARYDAIGYMSDGHGNVRIMAVAPRNSDDTQTGQTVYYFRKQGSRDWTKLSTIDENDRGFQPLGIDPATNSVYGLDDAGDTKAIYSVTLDDAQKKTLILKKEGVDMDGVATIGRQNRVVGASYTDDYAHEEYFDPTIKAMKVNLSKALPGNPAIGVIDASADENRLLLMASSDTMPGKYYVFDKTLRKLEELLPVRPELAGMILAPMKPIRYPATDGTIIPGYLTLPPGSDGKGIPAIVMPHGGPASRDVWGFDWLSQYFAQRGYAVLQPNYRGSTGYGSKFYQNNGFRSWRTSIGDVNDAGRWLVSQGIASPDKLAIVGWSYGGYAALQSAVLDPDLFKAIVAIAPVVDLEKLKDDASDFKVIGTFNRFIGSGPETVAGSPAQNAERIRAPVLMFSGDLDMNVDVSHPRLMERKLKAAGKQVTYVEFPGLEHSLVEAGARTRLLADSDAFLRRTMHLPAN